MSGWKLLSNFSVVMIVVTVVNCIFIMGFLLAMLITGAKP